MNLLCFVVLFLVLTCRTINSQYIFKCDENYCSTPGHECPQFDCEVETGRIIKNATTCGCCHLCIRTLKEGDRCQTTYYKWENKIAECGPGLICKKKEGIHGKCEPSECLKRVRNYSSNEKSKLNPTFECDYFGNFEPSINGSSKPYIVCLNDVLCFCVDKNGKRIFGTDIASKYNSSDMTCGCSRDINNFPKKVEYENLPRCLPNGDYDPLQCVNDKCICMHLDPHINDESVDAKNMKKLFCYKDDRRPEENRKTKCLKERKEEIRHYKDVNTFAIGADRTKCELDGTYYPLQCKKGRCFCVKRNGIEHPGFRNVTKEDGDLICRCMRDKEIIQSYRGKKTESMNIFERIKCDVNYTSSNEIISKLFIKDFMKP